MEEAGEGLALTSRGKDFLDNRAGDTVTAIDGAEGLLKILALIAGIGPARPGHFLPEWKDFCLQFSNCRSDATIKNRLQRRLRNLLERGLIARNGAQYEVTDEGVSYIQQSSDEEALGEHPDLWAFRFKQSKSVHAGLLELVKGLSPKAVEHLVKKLLEAMGYEDVKVTRYSGDGGVDVEGFCEVGITRVREVVQVKHHNERIQRKDVDALRGSLHRFEAVQGSIVATSEFSKGAVEDANAIWAAPITLIGQKQLINLLVEYGVGVRKRMVEVLEVSPEDFEFEVEDGEWASANTD